MTLLLDTNVISELRKVKTGKANPNITAWAKELRSTDLFISAITVLELEMGVLRIERRDPKQGALLRHWLDKQVLPSFAERILPIDQTVAIRCAQLHIPDPRAERDALIAACALTHSMTVVTRNTPDFIRTGVQIFNPWER